MSSICLLFIFAIATTSIDGQNETDDIPEIDITSILVDGLLRGASEQNRQLLADPTVSSALELFQSTIMEIVTYNLNATESISLSPSNCTIEPSMRSRSILDNYRDRAFACLQTYRGDLNAFVNYSFCLFDIPPQAKAEIDALKPSIDACNGASVQR